MTEIRYWWDTGNAYILSTYVCCLSLTKSNVLILFNLIKLEKFYCILGKWVGESDGNFKHSGRCLTAKVIDIYSYGNRNKASSSSS